MVKFRIKFDKEFWLLEYKAVKRIVIRGTAIIIMLAIGLSVLTYISRPLLKKISLNMDKKIERLGKFVQTVNEDNKQIFQQQVSKQGSISELLKNHTSGGGVPVIPKVNSAPAQLNFNSSISQETSKAVINNNTVNNKMILTGLIHQDTAKIAIISFAGEDYPLQIRDKINGWQVLEINDDNIVIRNKNNKYKRLKLDE